MEIKTLYKYARSDGGTTVSPTMPDVPYTIMYRIIASESKLVTRNGIDTYSVVDTDSADGWYEVADPDELLEQTDEEESVIVLPEGGEST